MQRVVHIWPRTLCILATRAGFRLRTSDFMRCLAQIVPGTAPLHKKGADIATRLTHFDGLARQFQPRFSPLRNDSLHIVRLTPYQAP